MKPKSILTLIALGTMGSLIAHADSNATTATFSNPNEPGRFQARLMHGEVLIQGADVEEVSVRTDASRDPREEVRDDGMRVLSSGASFSLIEKNNVITLDYGNGMDWAEPAQFVVTVPHDTHLDIEVSIGGEIDVDDISGDIAIKNLNGEIELQNISGGAIIESMNGEIEASFTELHPERPLSFTSMNGEIELHLPVDAQANVRFRTQNGSILTNFDNEEMVTTTTSGRTFAPEAHEEIAEFAAEMAEGAVEMAMEIAEEVRDAMAEARVEIAEAQREREHAEREMDHARAEMDRAQAEMERVQAEVAREVAKAPRAPRPPRPPSIPSMAGGKVVSGTLNGGGVDLQVATMNGDILIRKKE